MFRKRRQQVYPYKNECLACKLKDVGQTLRALISYTTARTFIIFKKVLSISFFQHAHKNSVDFTEKCFFNVFFFSQKKPQHLNSECFR